MSSHSQYSLPFITHPAVRLKHCLQFGFGGGNSGFTMIFNALDNVEYHGVEQNGGENTKIGFSTCFCFYSNLGFNNIKWMRPSLFFNLWLL